MAEYTRRQIRKWLYLLAEAQRRGDRAAELILLGRLGIVR